MPSPDVAGGARLLHVCGERVPLILLTRGGIASSVFENRIKKTDSPANAVSGYLAHADATKFMIMLLRAITR